MLNKTSSSQRLAEQYAQAIETLCSISEVYYYAGRMDDALHVLELGAKLAEATDVRSRDYIALLLQHGKLLADRNFFYNGDFDAALSTLERARQMAEAVGEEDQIATALDLIGLALYYRILSESESLDAATNDYDSPLGYFQQALELREAVRDERGLCETCFHLGLMFERKQQPDRAKAHYDQSVALAEQHGFKLEKSFATRHLGFLAARRQDWETARRHLEDSLALREEIGFKISLPFSYLAVGRVDAAQNDTAAALERYRQAYALAEEMNVITVMVSASTLMGDVYQDQNDIARARDAFERAYTLAQSTNYERGIANVKTRLEALAQSQNPD